MRTAVTGAAGFIGSHLSEALVESGHQVIGIDNFSDYYDRELKEYNIRQLNQEENFSLIEEDLLEIDLNEVLSGVGWIFHQAAQAGVRSSWGDDFEIYSDTNILATQQLLEAARQEGVERFIYASSSSVYGETDDLPMREEGRTEPVSPYGVSKLAGENLCQLYHHNFGLPAVSLRYFTVFGERQRPDMAFHIFIKSILSGEEITIFGDGKQSRNFTYIADAVRANLLAATANCAGEVYNIGGEGQGIELNSAIDMIEDITGIEARRNYVSAVEGDVRHTAADMSRAEKKLGYSPGHDFRRGLEREVSYIEEVYDL